ACISGDWTLFDRETGEDHGTLSIGADGSFTFTRLSDNATGSGTLSFEYNLANKGDEPDGFRMDFDDCRQLVPEDMELYGNEGTGGVFHIGTFGNEDYLYLKEIGNGDSVVSAYVFNTNADADGIEEWSWSYDWLFYRDNDTENPAEVMEDDTFYAWAWETEDDGVWLQPMTEHTYEAEEEYSEWKYLGGYFSETDNIGIAYYGITDDTDLTGLVNTHDWDSGYPLMMCEVTVDEEGNVDTLSDIDIVMYDSYYMGDIEPDYSYRDTTFTVDGFDIDITQYAPAATAITDAKRVGEWIIVECHNNPNINTYLFYNIPNGLLDVFEYQIEGANLIWQGDDLSTAVYQQYNSIYDIWGHKIGSIQEGELYELSFKDENTVAAGCWIVDEAGREKEFTKEFEYEPCDGAVWAYFEYLTGGGKQWRHLKEMADNAPALIIINPPEMIRGWMPGSTEYEKGALDTVAVIPLFDDSRVKIGSLKEDVKRGRAMLIEVTVPEGISEDTITVESPGAKKAVWEIGTLSGRYPQMSTFIR
ncbi:MAG: hypothetical protein K6G22_01925, partial [Lachnospiraceae bacterium]|nr:hypothetical protein [Lachnospiraceae bacterium]